MIETHELVKVYTDDGFLPWRRGERTVAVDGISLRIEEGQTFGLLGVNGAGKTTTVKMLCTLLEPTSGTATVGGYDVLRDANRVRRIVNMIAGGERMLYWRLTARENLAYFADLYNIDARVQARRIEALLEMVGLREEADRRVEQFSKGMKQRLQIARGLINDPAYLFMDEPTIGLDAPIARRIRQVIKGLDKTIVFTTHYMREAEELCDEIAVIHRGRIVEHGTPEQLKRRYQRTHTVELTIDAPGDGLGERLHAFKRAHDAEISTWTTERGYHIDVRTRRDVTDELVAIAISTRRQIRELRVVEPSLEDVVVAITGAEEREG